MLKIVLSLGWLNYDCLNNIKSMENRDLREEYGYAK